MSWPNRKLSDEPEEVEEHLLDPEDDPTRPTATVVAPCCGQRRCAADMVCWVNGEGWLCDACRAELRRDDSTPWTKPMLMRSMGAPPGAVRLEEIRRRARERVAEMKGRDEAVNRRQVTEQVPKDSYPDGGTGPPTS